MSRVPRDAADVHVGRAVIAWSASYGWISDQFELEDVQRRSNDLLVFVGDDGWLRDLTGPAPLAAVVRIDRELSTLLGRFEDLIDHLAHAARQATARDDER